ncbi:MAG: hypothetical protein NTX52_05190 [Planctomycetota bacterium]|nr:hypothetical protein [Planctomycetota bacterium]
MDQRVYFSGETEDSFLADVTVAAKVLVQQKEKRAIPYLKKLARESKDPSLAKAAGEAVIKINATPYYYKIR